MGSPFTSLVQETIGIPSDAEAAVTIRRLQPRWLRLAREVSQKKSQAEFREMGGFAFVKELEALGTGAVAEGIKQAQADPLNGHDVFTLLRHGIVQWSLDRPLKDDESLHDLNDDDQHHIARAVLKLTKPELFADAETALKNG